MNTHSLSHLDTEIERVLRDGIASASEPARPANPPPASSDGPPAPEMWGPNPPRADQFQSPLQLLTAAVENTVRLQAQVERLTTLVTGEQAPQKRIQPVPRKGAGLLPSISLLAHEIDAAHAEIERLVLYVSRRVS